MLIYPKYELHINSVDFWLHSFMLIRVRVPAPGYCECWPVLQSWFIINIMLQWPYAVHFLFGVVFIALSVCVITFCMRTNITNCDQRKATPKHNNNRCTCVRPPLCCSSISDERLLACVAPRRLAVSHNLSDLSYYVCDLAPVISAAVHGHMAGYGDQFGVRSCLFVRRSQPYQCILFCAEYSRGFSIRNE